MLDRLRRLARSMSADPQAGTDARPADGRPADDGRLTERTRMVEVQLKAAGSATSAVLAAILAVPRDAFVTPDLREVAYADDALRSRPARRSASRTSSGG